MKIKTSIGERIFNVINNIFMLLMILITLYPVLYVLFASFSDSNKLMRHSGFLLKPVGFSLAAYKGVFENPMILSGYMNTIIYVVLGLAISMLITVPGAYALSRKRIILKTFIWKMIVFTMYFSGGIVPYYILVKGIGLYNNIMAAVLPMVFTPMNLIILRSALEALPQSFEEAVEVDGGSDIVKLLYVVIPLSLPTISVILLFYAVAMWNNWFTPSLLLKDRELYPLQLVLREILIAQSADDMMIDTGVGERAALFESIKYATIVVSTVPILCVYPFLQKYFVKGVMTGGVKG